MVQQEINLYSHFEPPRTTADAISWKRYVLFNVIMTLLLVIIVLASVTENAYMKHQLKQLQIELDLFHAQFDKIKSKLPQLFFNKDINEAVKSMRNEIAAQQAIINILSKHSPFSNVLVAFSRTIVPNVWLSHINIQKNGDEIIIQGDGIGLNNIHEFIANMEKDKILGDYAFDLNQIVNKDVNDPNTQLNFEIKMIRKEHG